MIQSIDLKVFMNTMNSFSSFVIAALALCNTTNIQLPLSESKCPQQNREQEPNGVSATPPLPPLEQGLRLHTIALGVGTQNYTCALNSTAAPVSVGAVATLYNTACLADVSPKLFDDLSRFALLSEGAFPPRDLSHFITGFHFFSDPSTPIFDLRFNGGSGFLIGTKVASSPAPDSSLIGVGDFKFGAVPWLKLIAQPGSVEIKVSGQYVKYKEILKTN
jgi:hypothetical protein